MFNKYDAYKDSGVEWLGDMPKHWQLTSLKRLVKFQVGGTPSTSDSKSYDGDLPWVTIADLSGRYTNKFHSISKRGVRLANIPLTPKGSLLYSFKLSIGQVAFADRDLYTNEAIATFITNNSQSSNWLYYALPIFLEKNAANNIYGAKILNQDLIKNACILDVPLSEQIDISNFLDQKTSEIDQAIAIKEQQIALLNERKQIVIQKAVTQGLNPNVAMKDSGVEWIGKIPEHWECKPSRYAFRAVKRFKRDGSEIKFSVTQKWGVIPTDEMKENSTQAESFGGFQICLADDLVLNKYKAHLGVFWRAPSRGLITGNYTVFEPLKGINSKYFELLYHTPVYIDIFRTIVYGIVEGMMPLYNNDFYDMLSVVPPLHEQLEIVKFVEEEQEKFASIEHVYLMQIEKLKEYKTTLINDAVTGKIKVA